MSKSAESSNVSATTGFQPLALTPPNGIGTRLGAIGSGRPLTVSTQLADMAPEAVEDRLEAALKRCSGQSPVFRTRMMFPNDGPAYSVVSGVHWECPADRLGEAADIVEGAFRAAPADKIGAALLRLRMMTRGRDQRSASDQEAENIIWIEQLRCFPGDIVLATLKAWPTRKDGQWWPTWHEVQAELRRALDRRQALLNHMRALASDAAKAVEHHSPTDEERARAVERWEEMRASFIKQEDAPTPETPEQILERLEAMKANPVPVVIGEELSKKLEAIKAELSRR